MPDLTLVGLRWALKRSFLGYIARSPGGSVSLDERAKATEHKEIVFAPDLGLPKVIDEKGATYAFRGSATFRAHLGMLYVKISDPQVKIELGQGELTVLAQTEEGGRRLRLVTFSVADHLIADGYEHWAMTDVRLTIEGCALFNEVYPEGEMFEPFVIIVPEASQSEHGRTLTSE